MSEDVEMTNDEAIKGLKKLRSFHNGSYGEHIDMAIKALEAQTCIEDYPTCTECEHYDSEKHYCPRFCQVIKDTLAEAQPSEDCISRAEMLKYQQYLHGKMSNEENHKLWEFIKDLPSVTPQRPKGKWIEVLEHKDEFSSTWHYECSECKGRSYKGFEPLEKYCPNCGSYNGGGEE